MRFFKSSCSETPGKLKSLEFMVLEDKGGVKSERRGRERKGTTRTTNVAKPSPPRLKPSCAEENIGPERLINHTMDRKGRKEKERTIVLCNKSSIKAHRLTRRLCYSRKMFKSS